MSESKHLLRVMFVMPGGEDYMAQMHHKRVPRRGDFLTFNGIAGEYRVDRVRWQYRHPLELVNGRFTGIHLDADGHRAPELIIELTREWP